MLTSSTRPPTTASACWKPITMAARVGGGGDVGIMDQCWMGRIGHSLSQARMQMPQLRLQNSSSVG